MTSIRWVWAPERTESQAGQRRGDERGCRGGFRPSPGGVFCIQSSSRNSNRAVFLSLLQVPDLRGENGCIICGLWVLCLLPVVCFPALKAKPCTAPRWKADQDLSARPFVMSPRGGCELLQPWALPARRPPTLQCSEGHQAAWAWGSFIQLVWGLSQLPPTPGDAVLKLTTVMDLGPGSPGPLQGDSEVGPGSACKNVRHGQSCSDLLHSRAGEEITLLLCEKSFGYV